MVGKENKNTDKATSKESTQEKVLKITGDPKTDFTAYKKSKNYDFGIKMIEHYAPNNLNLIEYLKTTQDKNYLLYNLKVIINARS